MWLFGKIFPSTKLRAIDLMLFDFIAENAIADAKQFSSLGALSAGRLQGRANQLFFVVIDGREEVSTGEETSRPNSLKRRRQMEMLNDFPVGHYDCALDRVFEFTHIARPVITRQQFDCL